MRITLDIDESKLAAIQLATGRRKKSPAVALALDEFLENRRRQAFIARVMAGEANYATSNDELETFSQMEE